MGREKGPELRLLIWEIVHFPEILPEFHNGVLVQALMKYAEWYVNEAHWFLVGVVDGFVNSTLVENVLICAVDTATIAAMVAIWN